jgi:hypothetical protein
VSEIEIGIERGVVFVPASPEKGISESDVNALLYEATRG